MKVFSTTSELKTALGPIKGIKGLVPTMGALHNGHLSLVNKCRQESDVTIVSIFVNPTQFNDPKDLANYPRKVEDDLALLEKAGVDFVFTPGVKDIYPVPDTRMFDFGRLDKVMEGVHRPGHFNGVAQVVSRLFDIVECNKAFFGEKDFQQMAIIRDMVKRLGYNIEIIGCPIIRESDGLAMSSRNLLLTPEHRAAAPTIYKTMKYCAENARLSSVESFKKKVIDTINANPLLEVEYFDVVNADTLQSITSWNDAPKIRGCIAVHAGDIRLIDNIEIL